MMRKLVQQGASTMMISLPAQWIKKHGLKKGNEVSVSEDKGDLIVSAEDEQLRKLTIEIDSKKDFLNRYIDIPYLQGYDELTVVFKDATVMEQIVKRTEGLLGFEVVEQDEYSCKIKNVAEGMENEFENILRRIFLIVRTEAKDSLDAIKSKDYSRLRNIADLERMCHKYFLFCYRLLTKYGRASQHELPGLYLTLYTLEQISDHFSAICNYLADKKKVLDVKTYKKIVDIVLKFEKMYYDRSYAKARELKKDIKLVFDLFLEKKHGVAETKLAHIVELYFQLAPFIR